MQVTNPKKHCLIFLFFLVASFVACLRSSCFSPINSMIACCDPSIFYMCGKAWYHGYVPYVDIVDVKGPLLFFIFLVGQCITPDDTLGIFILTCFSLTTTLFFLYLTAKIYLKDDFPSVFASLVSLYVIWRESTFGGGGQSELFTVPFAAWLLYSFSSFLYADEITRKEIISLSISIGVGAAASLMIKFSTVLPFVVAFVIMLISKRKFALEAILCALAAFLLTCLPFAIWMIVAGNFKQCVQWYVLFNIKSYFGTEHSMVGAGWSSIASYVFIGIKSSLRNPNAVIAIISLLTSFYQTKSKNRYFAQFALLIVAVSFVVSSMGLFSYYQIFESVLAIYPAILISVCWKYGTTNRLLKVAVMSFLVILLWGYNLVVVYRNRQTVDLGVESSYNVVEQIVSRKKYSKVLYWGCLDLGFGKGTLLPADSLWVRHNGSSPEMDLQQKQVIKSKIPDYIFASARIDKTCENILREAGYEWVIELPSLKSDATSNASCGMSLWCRAQSNL